VFAELADVDLRLGAATVIDDRLVLLDYQVRARPGAPGAARLLCSRASGRPRPG
jgi:hypothetical protein